MDNKIFISYKRLNKDIVMPIVEEIEKQIGFKCWIDLDGIESGDQFDNIIAKAIQNSEILIFMMSKESLMPSEYEGEETWTQMELRHARKYHKKIVPISIDGSKLSDSEWFDMKYGGLNSIAWDEEIMRNKLFKDLRTWLGIQDKAQLKEEIEDKLKEWKKLNEQAKELTRQKDAALQIIIQKEKLLGDNRASTFIMNNNEDQVGNGMMQLQMNCLKEMLDEIRSQKNSSTAAQQDENELYINVGEVPQNLIDFFANYETSEFHKITLSGSFNISYYRIKLDIRPSLISAILQSYIGGNISKISDDGNSISIYDKEIVLNAVGKIKYDQILLPSAFAFFIKKTLAVKIENMDIDFLIASNFNDRGVFVKDAPYDKIAQLLINVYNSIKSVLCKIIVTNSRTKGLIASIDLKNDNVDQTSQVPVSELVRNIFKS